jgi:lysine 6-dehydrogenase
MRLLVIGAGMMGSAAAYDMARAPAVEVVTLADSDIARAKDAARRVNKLTRGKKVTPRHVDASRESDAAKLMRGHAAALSAVPYFFNAGLARAAIKAGCHFADLGGNNTGNRGVRKTQRGGRGRRDHAHRGARISLLEAAKDLNHRGPASHD